MIDYNKLLQNIVANRRSKTASDQIFSKEAFENISSQDYTIDSWTANTLSKIFAQAALSGWFSPLEVVRNLPNENVLLQQLHQHCTLSETTPPRWWLEKSTRKTVINKLLNGNQLNLQLDGDLPVTDEVGSYIRKILSVSTVPITATLTESDLLAYSLALEALEGIDLDLPDLKRVKLQIEKRNFLIEQGMTEPEQFIGRYAEQEKLMEFVHEQKQRPQWFGLILTGAGGAGKSALLNKFHTRIFHSNDAGISILDFDRPGINPRDTFWLETAIVKQIQLQFNMANTFDDEWNADWTDKINRAEFYAEESDSQKRASRDFLRRFRKAYVEDRILRPRVWILVLDTFEEVIQRGLTESIAEWLNELQSLLEPIKLNVIFSGRIMEERERLIQLATIVQTIEIDAFDRETSEQFLGRFGLPHLMIQRLLRNRSIPKRPLELKLLAQLYHQEGENGVRQLEKDLAWGGKNAALYTGIIYRRVLLRLERDELRLMAYPGLILRYLTVDLIQKVLAPVLGLDDLDIIKADRLLHELANYGWLAYLSDGRLWHRKDLRRTILQVMIANDPDTARKLHLAAINYFSENYSEENQIEVFYHQMMLGDFDNLPAYEKEIPLKTIEGTLQGDLLDFPKKSKIVFELLWRQRITRQQLDQLPRRYQPQGFEILGNRYLETQQFGAALSLMRQGERRHSYRVPLPENLIDWQKETLFQTGQWKYILVDLVNLPSQDLAANLNAFIILIIKNDEPDFKTIEAFKNYLGSSDLANQIERHPKHLGNYIGRLAICTMLIVASGPRDLKVDDDLSHLVRLLRQVTEKYRSPEIYRVILLLQLCAGQPLFPNYLMTVPFAKLDTGWLDRRTDYTTSTRVNENIGRIADILEDFGDIEGGWDDKKTPRTLLFAIDRVSRGAHQDDHNFPAIDPPRSFEEIKGPFPELRSLIKYALLKEFTGFDGAAELQMVFKTIIPFRFEELEPIEFFEIFRKRADRELTLYIELIDRMWDLETLLAEVARLRPHSEQLRQLHRLCVGWYSAYSHVWKRATL